MSNEETERRTALSEICQKMKEGIFIGDQKFLGMTFKNVFKGDYIQRGFVYMNI